MAVDPLLEHKRRHPINPHEFIGLAAKFGIHVDYVYLLMNDKLKKELDPYYIYFLCLPAKVSSIFCLLFILRTLSRYVNSSILIGFTKSRLFEYSRYGITHVDKG